MVFLILSESSTSEKKNKKQIKSFKMKKIYNYGGNKYIFILIFFA